MCHFAVVYVVFVCKFSLFTNSPQLMTCHHFHTKRRKKFIHSISAWKKQQHLFLKKIPKRELTIYHQQTSFELMFLDDSNVRIYSNSGLIVIIKIHLKIDNCWCIFCFRKFQQCLYCKSIGCVYRLNMQSQSYRQPWQLYFCL